MQMPKMVRVRQHFPNEEIQDIEECVASELARFEPFIQPGMTLAVTAGSRGIANIARILKAVVQTLQRFGARPFIVPAMGSHGGARAKGQTQVLASLGITEGYCGVPICSSMEVVQIGELPDFGGVFVDKHAYMADGIFLVNRIKAHTDYRSPRFLESGLVKMAAIGLGNHVQAEKIHSYGVKGLTEIIPKVTEQVLAKTNILGGLAIVENAYERTWKVQGLLPDMLFLQEAKLLQESMKRMPSLPVSDIDILYVDTMGKDYSGTGMDTNIIGRVGIPGAVWSVTPAIRYIIVGDLSDASHGNALGVGLADFTTERLYAKIDWAVTKENVRTSTFVERGKTPLVMAHSKEALTVALRCLWEVDPREARIIRILSTLQLGELYVSEALLPQIQQVSYIEVLGHPKELSFDAEGYLPSWGE